MGGSRFQTQANDYCHLAIVLPNPTAVTLDSLLSALPVPDAQGDPSTFAKQRQRVTGVRLTGQSAAYLWGKTAALALIPVAATGDLEEPIAGTAMLESFFQGAAGSVNVTAVVYLD
jgi:hypothetical protein